MLAELTMTSALELIGEQALRDGVDVLVRLVEAAGAVVVFAGATIAFVRFVVASLRPHTTAAFVRVRLGLGRYLALGLASSLALAVTAAGLAAAAATLLATRRPARGT